MCFYSVCIPEKYMYYFSENFNFLCFYYTNALADLLKNALQICDIFKCTCVYLTYCLKIETVMQMNSKVVKACYTISKQCNTLDCKYLTWILCIRNIYTIT